MWGGQAGHLHQLKATCHAGGDRDVTPADPGDSRPPGPRPPLSDTRSRDWAGGRRLSGEKVESCFLYAPRLLRACTCVCARLCVHARACTQRVPMCAMLAAPMCAPACIHEHGNVWAAPGGGPTLCPRARACEGQWALTPSSQLQPSPTLTPAGWGPHVTLPPSPRPRLTQGQLLKGSVGIRQ